MGLSISLLECFERIVKSPHKTKSELDDQITIDDYLELESSSDERNHLDYDTGIDNNSQNDEIKCVEYARLTASPGKYVYQSFDQCSSEASSVR